MPPPWGSIPFASPTRHYETWTPPPRRRAVTRRRSPSATCSSQARSTFSIGLPFASSFRLLPLERGRHVVERAPLHGDHAARLRELGNDRRTTGRTEPAAYVDVVAELAPCVVCLQ